VSPGVLKTSFGIVVIRKVQSSILSDAETLSQMIECQWRKVLWVSLNCYWRERRDLNSYDHAQKSCRTLHDSTTILNSFFSVCVSAQKNALHAETWRKSQQFFVCVYVSGKKMPCLPKRNLNLVC